MKKKCIKYVNKTKHLTKLQKKRNNISKLVEEEIL